MYMVGYRNITVDSIKLGQIDLASGFASVQKEAIDDFGTLENTKSSYFYIDSENGIGVSLYGGYEFPTYPTINHVKRNPTYANGLCTAGVVSFVGVPNLSTQIPVTFSYDIPAVLCIPVEEKNGKITLTIKSNKPYIKSCSIGTADVIGSSVFNGKVYSGVGRIITYNNFGSCKLTETETVDADEGIYKLHFTFSSFKKKTYKDVSGTEHTMKYIPLAVFNSAQVQEILVEPAEEVGNGMLEIDGRWNATAYGIRLEKQNGVNTGREDGEMALYPQKVVEEELGIELEHIYDSSDVLGTGIMLAERISAKNPEKVQIEFDVQGLFKVLDGFRLDTNIDICIQYSIDGGKTYKNMPCPTDASGKGRWKCVSTTGALMVQGQALTGLNVYRLQTNSTSEMRFNCEHTFTYEEAMNCRNRYIEFRIFRYNPKGVDRTLLEHSESFNDVISLTAIRTWCYDFEKSKGTYNVDTKKYQHWDEENSRWIGGTLVKQAPLIKSKRDITTRLAFQVNADSNEFTNQLNELNCIVTSKGRTCEKIEEYNDDGDVTGSHYEWSSADDLSPVQNPASLMLMLLEHESRGKYKYTDSDIDLQKLGELYEYCNTSRRERGMDTGKFVCNGVLTSQSKTNDIIKDILSTCRASLVLKDGKYSVWIDNPANESKALFTSRNVMSCSVAKEYAEEYDGVKIKFINEKGNYSQDELKVLYNDRDAYDEDKAPNLSYKSLDFKYQTDASQVYQNGKYYLATQKLQPEQISIRTSFDSSRLAVGDRISTQLDTLSVGIGDGGEIKELIYNSDNDIVGIKTDCRINMQDYDESDEYEITIQQTSNSKEPEIITVLCSPSADDNGLVNTFNFEEPFSATNEINPEIGDMVAFGYKGSSVLDCLIFGIKDNGDSTYDLTCAPYQEGIYEKDSEEIPEFDSKVTVKMNNPLDKKSATTLDVIEKTQDMEDKIEEALTTAKSAEEIAENLAENPTIYADISSIGVAVNDNDLTTVAQEFTVSVYVRQGAQQLDFYFAEESFNLPAKWTYRIKGNKITFTVPSDVIVTTENLYIPVMFTAFKYDFEYGDETGDTYYNGDEESYYGCRTSFEYESKYDLTITAIGVQGGRYLGACNRIGFNDITIVNNNVEVLKEVGSLIIGDYVTWCGTETECEYVKDGVLYPSAIYQFNGVRSDNVYWVKDSMAEHCGGQLSDVLAVANHNLEANNSTAYQFLDHLTANSIFVDRLVANKVFANEAIIGELFANNIVVNNGGIIKSENYNGTIEDGEIKEHGTAGWMIDSSGNAEFININAQYGNISDIDINNARFQGTIDSGCLYSDMNKPEKGNHTLEIGESLTIEYMAGISGTYRNKEFDKWDMSTSYSHNDKYGKYHVRESITTKTLMLFKNGTRVASFSESATNQTIGDTYPAYPSLTYKIQVTQFVYYIGEDTGVAGTLRFINIPQYLPATDWGVWVDTDGFVRLNVPTQTSTQSEEELNE